MLIVLPLRLPLRMLQSRIVLWGCLLFLFLVLIGGGIASLTSGLEQQHQAAEFRRRFPQPQILSLKEFIAAHPKEGWFRIPDVPLSVLQGRSANERPTSSTLGIAPRAALSIYPTGSDPETSKAPVVVLTWDKALYSLIREIDEIRSRPDSLRDVGDAGEGAEEGVEASAQAGDSAEIKAQIKRWVEKNKDRLVKKRTVEGLVVQPTALAWRDLQLLTSMRSQNAPDCILIEEGITPQTREDGGKQIRLGITCLVIGGIIIAILVAVVRLQANAEVADVQAQLPTTNGPPATYTFKHPKRGKLSGISEDELLKMCSEDDVSVDTLLINERTGEMMPLSRLHFLRNQNSTNAPP